MPDSLGGDFPLRGLRYDPILFMNPPRVVEFGTLAEAGLPMESFVLILLMKRFRSLTFLDIAGDAF